VKGGGLKAKARRLRRGQTETEKRLWRLLRNRELLGHKFRRQQPLSPFVVDFCCLEKKLVVELDGGQHAERPSLDERRTEWLKREGYRLIRFWDNEMFENTQGVLEKIFRHLDGAPSPRPSPLKGEGAIWKHKA
jgi:very-short-patch-repair endonuclease